MSLLKTNKISKSFYGIPALLDVDFTLSAGEIHVLLGQNGAGKSTLIKILSGALNPDSGTIEVGGETLYNLDPNKSRFFGVTTIYQEFNLIPDLSVAENIFLGRLKRTRSWPYQVDWKEMKKESQEFFDRIGINLNVERPIHSLSIAEQQLVEIAKALSFKAQIIILDEPTAALTRREIIVLFELLRELKRKNYGVIYISHRLDEITEIGDQVTVLRDGVITGTWKVSAVTTDKLISEMVGRAIDRSGSDDNQSKFISNDIIVKGIKLSDGIKIKQIDFNIHKGEILGLAGLVGSGRTELARLIFGANKIISGELFIKGQLVSKHSCSNSISLKIGFLPEDRKTQGLLLNFSIQNNITLPSLKSFSHLGFLDKANEAIRAKDYIQKLIIKANAPDQKTHTLSGGNQQKVVLAKWLEIDADILIFDEPTRGIDVAAKEEFYKLILNCASQGVAILLISSELSELIRLSDRIMVLREGESAGCIDRSEFSMENLLSRAFGHANLVNN